MRLPTILISLLSVFVCSHLPAQINREAPRFTPTIDGTITDEEAAGQLEYHMQWPIDDGFIAFEGSGSDPENLSATWYVSWDSVNINFSAVVFDDTPDFRLDSGGFGNVPYNAQDVIQPTFNPFNDLDNFFAPDPGGGPAAIYDLVVNTLDDFGPDVYRHGDVLDDDQHQAVTIAGQETDTGYILETSIPWAVAMDDVDENYQPKVGDEHGLSFILLSFNGDPGATADIATLYTDFGFGANTIGDPTTWNSLTLIEGAQVDTLLPGDSNMDLQFNQLDLVQVQIAAKYVTGQAATWGDGDWNGAPGGSPGDPPSGDGVFNQLDIISALGPGHYLTGPYAATPPGVAGDGQTSIVYNANTGEVGVDAPAGTNVTSVNIDSTSGMFVNHENAENLDGSFDTHSGDNIFKATFGTSFGSLSFGAVAQPGLAEDVVAADLSVVGSLQGGGGLGDVDLVYVPEPSTIFLFAMGLVLCLRMRKT